MPITPLVSARVPEQVKQRIDQAAEDGGINRTEVIRQLLSFDPDQLKQIEQAIRSIASALDGIGSQMASRNMHDAELECAQRKFYYASANYHEAKHTILTAPHPNDGWYEEMLRKQAAEKAANATNNKPHNEDPITW